MKTVRAAARSFLLVELLAVIALSGILLSIAGKLVVEALYLERAAVQQVTRLATIESLTEQLRRDTLATSAWQSDGPRLAVKIVTPTGPGRVTYVFDDDGVRRDGPGLETREWRAPRLTFASRVQPGPRGGVLSVDFVEHPPPRARHLPDRRVTTAFYLPGSTGPEEAP